MDTPEEKREIEWYETKYARDRFINYAEDYCNGIETPHYEAFTEWYFKKKRKVAFNPMLFVQYVTRSVYSIEQLKESKSNPDKIKVLPVERWGSKA